MNEKLQPNSLRFEVIRDPSQAFSVEYCSALPFPKPEAVSRELLQNLLEFIIETEQEFGTLFLDFGKEELRTSIMLGFLASNEVIQSDSGMVSNLRKIGKESFFQNPLSSNPIFLEERHQKFSQLLEDFLVQYYKDTDVESFFMAKEVTINERMLPIKKDIKIIAGYSWWAVDYLDSREPVLYVPTKPTEKSFYVFLANFGVRFSEVLDPNFLGQGTDFWQFNFPKAETSKIRRASFELEKMKQSQSAEEGNLDVGEFALLARVATEMVKLWQVARMAVWVKQLENQRAIDAFMSAYDKAIEYSMLTFSGLSIEHLIQGVPIDDDLKGRLSNQVKVADLNELFATPQQLKVFISLFLDLDFGKINDYLEEFSSRDYYLEEELERALLELFEVPLVKALN